MGDEQQRALSLEPWLMSLIIGEAACSPQEETIFLQVPSGREVYVHICWLAVLDAQKHAVGTVYVIHDITHFYQKALHLQRVHQAVLNLREAIAHIPEHIHLAFQGGPALLALPAFLIGRHLV